MDPARPTRPVAMTLEALHWTQLPHGANYLEFDVGVWPVFFKIDGTTAHVSDLQDETQGKLVGTVTISGTGGTGRLAGRLKPDGVVSVPPDIGQWSDLLTPIPIGPMLGSSAPDAAAAFGVAAVVFDPGALEADALEAGHAALNAAVESGFNDLIGKLKPLQRQPDPDQIDEMIKQVKKMTHAAIKGAMDFLDKAHNIVVLNWFNDVLVRLDQDDLPATDFDQSEFAPGFDMGIHLGGESGVINVIGTVGSSRREVGQGSLGHFDRAVLAVAGYADETNQHAIVATDDGVVTELWWQGSGGVSQGALGSFSSPVVALAGFHSPDGFQHVVVATQDLELTEMWWQGTGEVGRGVLGTAARPVAAIAGYASGDGIQHVIVATKEGTVTEFYWPPGGTVAQNAISHFSGRIVDVAGYYAGDGTQHVIVATADGTLTEIWWQGTGGVGSGTLAKVETPSWNHLVGVGGFFAPSDKEQHVVVAQAGGTLREYHWSPVNDHGVLHDDLTAMPHPAKLDAYVDADGNQHAIVATAGGDIREAWWPSVWTAIMML